MYEFDSFIINIDLFLILSDKLLKLRILEPKELLDLLREYFKAKLTKLDKFEELINLIDIVKIFIKT